MKQANLDAFSSLEEGYPVGELCSSIPVAMVRILGSKMMSLGLKLALPHEKIIRSRAYLNFAVQR